MKLVVEKEQLLATKEEELKQMKDKVLRSYAEMENVMERTRRESENSKKFAIQVCGFIFSLTYAFRSIMDLWLWETHLISILCRILQKAFWM